MNTKAKVLVLLLLGGIPCIKSEKIEDNQSQNKDVHEWDESEDFEDFFCVDDENPRTIERLEKEKMSRAKILIIRLGIKTAMACESFYTWLCSVCAYFKSFVWRA